MNFIVKAIAFSLALAGAASAADKEFYLFSKASDKSPCILSVPVSARCVSESGTRVNSISPVHSLRFKILGATEDNSALFGVRIERPFFIIDGIHLSTDEERTLEQLQEETEAFGIPEVLKSIGYTPVLVQFPQTVRVSLVQNSEYFRDLLRFLSSNTVLPFPNGREEGFVVLGISQGGIIGRYGSYLYDKDRKPTDAPVRLFASLDSPHQGAVMPRSLMSTIDFWATMGGSAAAEAFRDLIRGPGARDLLIYETDKTAHGANTSASRFLFGDYREAAEYKGFPAILVAQGQLKGKDPAHSSQYYTLNRKATLAGVTVGRANSKTGYSDSESEEFAHQSVYEQGGKDAVGSIKGKTEYDFVQGSTYPFPKTMYKSLREGFLEAMPHGMTKKIITAHIPISTSWDRDNLYQESSTFIPTASAMDIKCEGDLAIRKNCAHTLKASEVAFENPGNTSTGTAVFGVDPTHPRYGEPISGRHIESPVKDGGIDSAVLAGMQADVWRILCEVAKADYDKAAGKFRNPKLNGIFSEKTSCMDLSKMPDLIRNAGKIQSRRIAYARYNYNAEATEKSATVPFALPAGWQKVAKFNIPDDIPAGSAFEIDISSANPKSNWMKAELLMVRDARGNGQIQLNETDVKQDGLSHTLRWVMPNTQNSTLNYKWLQLVLNSNGADVTLSAPRIITSTTDFAEMPEPIPSAKIFPEGGYKAVPWSSAVSLQKKTVGTSEMLYATTASRHDGFHFDFGKAYSMDAFTALVVEFEPGTCTRTEIYFDAKDTGSPNLGDYRLQNGYANKILPLQNIVNTQVTPNRSLSASRLKIQATRDNETCNIKAIYLQ